MENKKQNLTGQDKYFISKTIEILESMSDSKNISFMYSFAKEMKAKEDSINKGAK